MLDCPCGSQKKYVDCCEPYLTYQKCPREPEALMRSRYTAYTQANIDYIQKTMSGKASMGFEEVQAKRWAKSVVWIKLNLIQAFNESPIKGYVEFEACFVQNGVVNSIHEKSEFIQDQGQWRYVDGLQLPPTHPMQHITNQTLCPCGSQKKFKHCHNKSRLS